MRHIFILVFLLCSDSSGTSPFARLANERKNTRGGPSLTGRLRWSFPLPETAAEMKGVCAGDWGWSESSFVGSATVCLRRRREVQGRVHRHPSCLRTCRAHTHARTRMHTHARAHKYTDYPNIHTKMFYTNTRK